jgi:chaperonin cofactor prefoldin
MQTKQQIPAFSLFEVTVVLGLMSLLIGIIYTAMNRFQEQLYKDQEVKQELSDFFVFRANLWRELDECDSAAMVNDVLYLYQADNAILYKNVAGDLLRKREKETDFVATKQRVESISLSGSKVQFLLAWKKEQIAIEYLFNGTVSNQINAYFDALSE